MEIKGVIKKGNNVSLTCCEHLTDILIDEVSLYDKLSELFDQDEVEHYECRQTSPIYSIRYVILNKKPKEYKTFEQQSAEVVVGKICAELNTGCYSEWTCGHGGFDYVLDDNGHSIFKELESFEGKYVHLII